MLNYDESIYHAIFEPDSTSPASTMPERLSAVHPLTVYDNLSYMYEDCEAVQRKVLAEILERAQGTAYAADHGLNGVHTLEEWRAVAKASLYQDYQPYVEREMDGEKGQLYNAETAMYVATTGSTGNMKYFLESIAGNVAKDFMMTVRGLYLRHTLPIIANLEAKNLTITNYAPLDNGHDKNTLTVRASGQTARNIRKRTGTMNILSVEFWETTGITARDRDYLIAVYALNEAMFSKVCCNNLIHFGRILDRIAAEGQQMIEDIRTGEFSVPMPDDVRETLRGEFSPNPARADALQEIYNRHNCLLTCPDDIEAIWPELQAAMGWLAASVGRDAREVLRRLPKKVKCHDMGYGASEGKLTIPMKLGSATGACAPFNCFYEFLPVEQSGEKDAQPLCMWEVEKGKYYELMITTYSGLYRYNMLDVVKVVDFVGKTPVVLFCGKSTDSIMLDTGVIYGYQIADTAQAVERQLGIEFDLVQAFGTPLGYSLILETKADAPYHAIRTAIDEIAKVQLGCVPQAIYMMDHTYKDSLFTARTRVDRGACGIKLPVVAEAAPEGNIIQIL
ncbi:MAG: GH3 auxin-responsive promoter family protein [Peptococcaceae bacterium]|nr:GH3 auxin-responsive promoter family protein [Peptococcaceae bacterium]